MLNRSLAAACALLVAQAAFGQARPDAVWELTAELRPRMPIADVRRALAGRTAGQLVCPLSPDTRIEGEGTATGHCGAVARSPAGEPPVLVTIALEATARDTVLIAVGFSAQLALAPTLQPERYFKSLIDHVSRFAGAARCADSTSCTWSTATWQMTGHIGGLGPRAEIRLLPVEPARRE